ncbi:MAG: ATP-binding protein [Pseudomonadota bacterium]
MAFIIASGMPLAIFWSWPYSRILDSEIAGAYDRHLLIAENLSSSLAEYHRDLTIVLDAYGPLISNGGGDEAWPIFEDLGFRHICVVNADTGALIRAYLVEDQPCPNVVPDSRLTMLRDLADGAKGAISPVVAPPDEAPRIFLAKRIGNELVIGAVGTEFFDALIAQVQFGEQGHAAILDQTGQTLAHPMKGQKAQTYDLSGIPLFERFQQGETGVEMFFSPLMQEEMVAGFAPVPGVGWGVIVPQPMAELKNIATGFNRDALVVLSIGVFLSLGLALALSVQFSRQLGYIAKAVHLVAEERDDVRVNTGRKVVAIEEFETLVSDINRLAKDSAEARHEQIKYNQVLEAANASMRHEMNERLSAEAARETSEVRFRSLFESAPIPIREEDLSGMKALINEVNLPDPQAFSDYIDAHPEFLEACSREIVVVDANRASLEQHGYKDKSEMLQKVVRTLSPAARKIVRKTVETLHSGALGRSYETQITRTDGSVRTVAAKWSVIPGHEETYGRILLCSIDLTERLKSEEALQHAMKLDAVGQLTGGVAHDFNNLLTVIGGNIDLMEATQNLDPEIGAPIHKAVRRGADLTQRLLAFSRKQPLSPQAVNLGELLMEMTELLRRTLGEEIAIEIDIEDPLWSAIADPGQVETSLLNMALNSRDAMPGGGTLSISSHNVTLEAAESIDAEPGDYVRLSVADTGVGMSPEVLSRAFEPFFTTKDVGKGSGLGLSSVYGFAKQSGGDVQIASTPGQGTTIALYLPRSPAPARPADVTPAPVKSIDGNGRVTLVLEDDSDVRKFLTRTLAAFGFSVLQADSVAEARRILKADHKIDLLISDVMLPGGVLGPEFAAEMLGAAPRTSVVFISGRPGDAKIEAFPALRHASVLAKPFTRDDLVKQIEAADAASACAHDL